MRREKAIKDEASPLGEAESTSSASMQTTTTQTTANRFFAPVLRGFRRLRGGKLSPGRFAASVAVGLFVGTLPLYGAHFLLCAAIGVPLRLDVLVAYAAAHISIPPFIPFLLYGSTQLGALLLTGRTMPITLESFSVESAGELGLRLGVGSVVLGLLLAITGGLLAWFAAQAIVWARRGEEESSEPEGLEAAVARVAKRYDSAPSKHRYYVRSKLLLDPATRQLYELVRQHGALGDVVDAGCGRGQYSLFLAELEAVSRITGFDHDAGKVEAGRIAARGAGGASGAAFRYEIGDLCTFDYPESDTVLLLDVLHYLSGDAQREVLVRVVQALRPGGIVVLRETNRGKSVGAFLAGVFERIGRVFGVNHGRELDFRPTEFFRDALTDLGCVLVEGQSRGPLDNVFLVAKKPRHP